MWGFQDSITRRHETVSGQFADIGLVINDQDRLHVRLPGYWRSGAPRRPPRLGAAGGGGPTEPPTNKSPGEGGARKRQPAAPDPPPRGAGRWVGRTPAARALP